MEKEFNLSEKESIEGDCKYDRVDVKEFIKRLKKELDFIDCRKVDKLAGDKLI